jgi:hypothetical protein
VGLRSGRRQRLGRYLGSRTAVSGRRKTPPLLDHSAIPREEERADAITGLSREEERTTRFRNS